MRAALSALALVTLAAAPSASAAEAIAVLPATGSGAAADELSAAAERLRLELERSGRFVAVPVASPAPAGEEPAPAQAAQAARAAGAPLAAVLRISRLGRSAFARLAAYRADGTVAFAQSAEAAPGEPIDAAVARLAAAFTGTSGRPAPPPPPSADPWQAAAAPTAQPTPSPPAQPIAQPEPRFGAGGSFRAGAIFPRNRASTDERAPVFAGFGLAPWLDAGPFIVDFTFDAYLSDLAQQSRRDFLVSVGTDALFPLGRGPVAPYLGAGLGYAWYRFGGSGADGALLRVPAGLIISDRHGDQVRLEAAWFATGGHERDLVTGELRRPWGWTLTLAFGGK